jgi:hypothetical protein
MTTRTRAFSFVELCIGLVVVSLVLGALAAFSLATAEAWKQGVTTNSNGGQNIAVVPIIANLVCTRLNNEIGGAAAVGGYYPGNLTSSSGQQAAILLWKQNLDASSKISPNEVDLIEYDPTNHMIWLYKGKSTVTTPLMDYTAFTTSWMATFKDPSMSTKVPLARNVDGMQIDVNNACSASQLPLVEYRLYFNRGGQAQTRYESVSLRSPTRASLQPQT